MYEFAKRWEARDKDTGTVAVFNPKMVCLVRVFPARGGWAIEAVMFAATQEMAWYEAETDAREHFVDLGRDLTNGVV